MPSETRVPDTYQIEQLSGGVLLVRIPSGTFNGQPLPDAVFTFRIGEPQYDRWLKRYYEQQGEPADSTRKKTGGGR